MNPNNSIRILLDNICLKTGTLLNIDSLEVKVAMTILLQDKNKDYLDQFNMRLNNDVRTK